jgi:hypothetical protein
MTSHAPQYGKPCAVREGVNELRNEKSKVPSSAEEGWPKAGVVLVKKILFELNQHHPVCAFSAATPPLLRRGYVSDFTLDRQSIHTFTVRAFICDMKCPQVSSGVVRCNFN